MHNRDCGHGVCISASEAEPTVCTEHAAAQELRRGAHVNGESALKLSSAGRPTGCTERSRGSPAPVCHVFGWNRPHLARDSSARTDCRFVDMRRRWLLKQGSPEVLVRLFNLRRGLEARSSSRAGEFNFNEGSPVRDHLVFGAQ